MNHPNRTTQTRRDDRPVPADEVCDRIALDRQERRVAVGDAELHLPDQPGIESELAIWLYLHLHVGNPDAFSLDSLRPDQAFEAALVAALPDLRLPVPESSVASASEGGMLRHDVDRVWVVDRHAPTAAEIRVPCARPNLSPGYFMFVHEPHVDPTDSITRFYVAHDDPDVALADWAGCIEALVAADADFRTKLLSRRSAFPRNDAMVVYGRGDPEAIHGCMNGTSASRSFAETAGSALCRRRHGAIDTAAEPAGPGLEGQKSFGEHRCEALADAIVGSFDNGSALTDEFAECCAQSNIDPTDVSRNVR